MSALDRSRPRRTGGARPGARLVALVTALALLVVSLGAVGASAQATTASACPRERVPATAFTDTMGSVHRASIDCLTWWGITGGRTPTVYAPSVAVTRGQIAAMLARLLERAGLDEPNPPSAGFVDTRGHLFEREIDMLAHLGVVLGVTPTRYEPDEPLNRARMATVLARIFSEVSGTPLPSAPLPFTDVSPASVHADAIARIAAAGITTGVTPTLYQPTREVVRQSMASFIMRSAAVLVDRGQARPPAGDPAAGDAYHSRMRGAWVHLFDNSLKTETGIRRVVLQLIAADANVVIAQVARRHDAYFDSSVLPPTPDPALEDGLDVLEELLYRAHRNDIEVHAWISVAPQWHPVYDQLGITRGTLGAPNSWLTYSYDGVRSDYLDPGIRPVQDHVAAIVRELATKYPTLDGIHLDYVRYESNRHGYHPDALARFRAETGYVGTPAPTNTTWSNWRRDQTREIMRRARAVRGGADLSAAVISWGAGPATPDRDGFQGTTPYQQVLQDWDRWAREGIVDDLMPMNYFREHELAQRTWYRQWIAYERALNRETPALVAPGIAGYLNYPAGGRTQIGLAMQRVNGSFVYSYQQPTIDASRDLLTDLADARWDYPPATP
jgi:uncharacterized lipoprotein YddW (UPF0748 family)